MESATQARLSSKENSGTEGQSLKGACPVTVTPHEAFRSGAERSGPMVELPLAVSPPAPARVDQAFRFTVRSPEDQRQLVSARVKSLVKSPAGNVSGLTCSWPDILRQKTTYSRPQLTGAPIRTTDGQAQLS